MSLGERLAAPVGSLCVSALAGALFVGSLPGGPSAEEYQGSERQQRALGLQLSATRAALLSSLGWNVLALLDAPRACVPPIWGASFAAYVATFAYRCLVSGEDS